ncbi:MAG: hypothetical protein VX737_02185 [Pseudomonadota bacterium]|nr:hypothetical protein [Pseudomonadota bacterium]
MSVSKYPVVGDHHYFDGSPSLKDIIIALVQVFCSYGLGFLLSYLLLRSMSIDLYGDFVLAQNTIYVVGGMLLLGTKNVQKRFMFAYWPDDFSNFSSFAWWHTLYVFKSILIFSVVYSVVLLLLLGLGSLNFIALAEFHIMVWSLVASPFWAVFCVTSLYLLVGGYPLLFDFSVQILCNLVCVLCLGVLVYFQPNVTDYGLILYTISSVFFAALVVVVCFFCLFRDVFLKVVNFDRSLIVKPEWTAHRLSSFLIDVSLFLPNTIVIFVVEFFSGQLVTGQFSLCFVVGGLPFLIHYVFCSLVLKSMRDWLSSFSARSFLNFRKVKDVHKSVQFVKNTNRVIFLFNLCFLMVIYFFGHEVLSMFNQDSEEAYYLLLEASLISCLRGVYYPGYNFSLIYVGLSRFVGFIDLIMCLCLFVFGSFLVIFVGPADVMHLYLVLQGVQLVLSHYQFKKMTGFPFVLL